MFRVVTIASPQHVAQPIAFGSFEFTTMQAAHAAARWLVRWPGVQVLAICDTHHSRSFKAGETLYETASTGGE